MTRWGREPACGGLESRGAVKGEGSEKGVSRGGEPKRFGLATSRRKARPGAQQDGNDSGGLRPLYSQGGRVLNKGTRHKGGKDSEKKGLE